MCNPAVAGVVIAAVGAGMQAYGQRQAGRIRSKQALQNSRTAEFLKRDAAARGDIAEQRVRLQAARFRGRQSALIASSGAVVDEGSALDVQLDTAMFAELDALTARNNAVREVYGLSVRQNDFLFMSQSSLRAGNIAAGATILGAAGSLVGPISELSSRRAPSGPSFSPAGDVGVNFNRRLGPTPSPFTGL